MQIGKLEKTRDISIDILKFFAAILITNSHMGELYVHFKQLCTGGAIGDALFFFCSGYTLFLGKKRSFANYYKQRIKRIYPTVFSWAILASFILGCDDNMKFTILHGGRWFVSCIMIYYIPIYFIQKYCIKYVWHFMFLSLLLSFLWLYFFDDAKPHNFYGDGNCRYIFFFVIMLGGALVGSSKKKSNDRQLYNVVKMVLCIIIFYLSIHLSMKLGSLWRIQILSIFPLFGIVVYMHRLCNSDQLAKLYYNKYSGFIIRLIGGLCLEIYLVQFSLFTNKMNQLFPLNIVIMFLIIVIAAYIVRIFSRIFSQIFSDEDFNWRKIVEI